MLAQDDSYDGLPPVGFAFPTKASVETAEKAEMIEYDLIRAANGTEVAWNISNALESLENANGRSVTPLPEENCNKLIRALLSARGRTLALFHQSDDCSAAAEGCEAAIGLIFCWRDKAQHRSERREDILIDLKARARILRNLCHNICLREEIEQRQTERFAGTREASRGRKTAACRTAM